MSYVRSASHAGAGGLGWYDSIPAKLKALVENFVSNAPTFAANAEQRLFGVIVPHPGIAYGGPTAAAVFRVLGEYLYSGSPKAAAVERIFILGPSHHASLVGLAFSGASAYETPFGPVPVDVKTVQALQAGMRKEELPVEQWSQATDEREHSIEMEMPFISHLLHYPALYAPGAAEPAIRRVSIVPIAVGGGFDLATEAKFAGVLSPYMLSEKNIFVLSSDFCHWGDKFRYTFHYEPRSYPQIGDAIIAMDHAGMNLLSEGNWSGWRRYLDATRNTICGRRAINLAVSFFEQGSLKSDVAFRFLGYSQSRKCASETESSVSYASAVIHV